MFLLGLATGVTLLTVSAYRRVSPSWLKRLLMGCGLLMAGRYVTMALFAATADPARVWPLHRLWLGSAVGLTFPGVVAVDQLIRHPAMTPRKLLRWCSPFLIAYGAVMLAGDAAPVADRVAGWAPRLAPLWRLILSVVQALFVIGFIGLCLLLMRKIPSASIRKPLLALSAAYAYLGADGLLIASGHWYFRPFLYSELAALLALWYAYETAHALQQQSLSL